MGRDHCSQSEEGLELLPHSCSRTSQEVKGDPPVALGVQPQRFSGRSTLGAELAGSSLGQICCFCLQLFLLTHAALTAAIFASRRLESLGWDVEPVVRATLKCLQ